VWDGDKRVRNTSRVVKGANALLYFGPLLAGLGGFGWAVAPAFALIFMLWLVVMRPQDFPRSWADWLRPAPLVAVAARLAVQLLLVLMCFGVGRGLGGVMNSLPPIPMMLPISLSLLAIPLARLVWNPWQTAAMDDKLEDALTKIEDVGVGGDRAYADAVLTPLLNLPDQTTEEALEHHLSALRALVDEAMTFSVLLDRVEGGDASVCGRRALMIMASDGAALDRMGITNAPGRVMQALGADTGLVARMAERLVHALRQDSEIWPDCPSVAFLEGLAALVPDAAPFIAALEAEIMAQAHRA
jgi:hypothetical protein